MTVELPFSEALSVLADDPRTWLPQPAEPHPDGTVVLMHATSRTP